MSRWFTVLALTGLLMCVGAFGASDARAQVFKPRTGNGKAAPAAKTSAPSATATPAGAKKSAPVASAPVASAPAAASSKKPTRATGPTPRRVGTTTPAKKARAAKRHGDDDTVVVDDDDDVKITDD